MPPLLVTVVLAASLAVAAVAAGAAALGRPPGRGLLRTMFALQALLFVQLLVVLGRLSGGARPAETGTFAGYVVLSLLLLPGGLALAVEERTRWGSAVLAVACLTVAVVELRLDATWR